MHHDVVIVGGGVSGLATAFWLRRERPELDVVVLEAGDAAGGYVRSTIEDGFTVDWGPNALLPGNPDTTELIEELGLVPEVVPASKSANRRYVVCGGALVPLPGSPATLLGTPLLSPRGKLRALLEPIVGRGGSVEEDESVTQFVRRRFGREAADALAELMVSGLVAGDPERLSAEALFPRLLALEQRHGSVLRGLIAQRRAGRRSADGGPRPEGRRSFSFLGGLGRLTEALTAALGSALRTGTPVTALRPDDCGFEVEVAGGDERLTAGAVVLATPAYVTAKLLADFAPEVAGACRGIQYAGVAVAALGYDRATLAVQPEGFGFLAVRGEGVRSLGVQFSSSSFPAWAPDGAVLVRAIAGGVLDQGFMSLSEADAVAALRRDLEVTLGITSEPVFVRYRKLPAAIPQYEAGHAARLERLERGLAPFKGLRVVGNAYRGVGVNDCVREARSVAATVAVTL